MTPTLIAVAIGLWSLAQKAASAREERSMAIPSPTRPRPWRVVVIAAAALALVFASGSAARTSATTTIVVNTIADAVDTKPADGVCVAKIKAKGGPRCSLRAAIQTANAGSRAGHYTIVLPAGTLHLAVAGRNEGKAAKGDLDVLQADLTVVGKGPAKTAIDAGGIDRVFDVSAFAHLSAQGLRITGGKTTQQASKEGEGGALRVSGTLALENVLVDSNIAADNGGGLYVAPFGTADLKQVTFSHNVANDGAGVDAGGSVSMTNVTLSGNNAITTGGGIHVWKGRADLVHVTVTGNTAPSTQASAISNGGALTLRSSIVAGTCQQPQGDHFPYPQRNVVTNKTCGDDPPVGDAGLLPLAASGNGLPTVGLKATSPAIDSAFSDTCPKVDARGVARPQGSGCDAGAYELISP